MSVVQQTADPRVWAPDPKPHTTIVSPVANIERQQVLDTSTDLRDGGAGGSLERECRSVATTEAALAHLDDRCANIP